MKNKTNIEKIRHSLSHIMAWSVKEQFPEVKLGIGPTIENGFYYDFDFSEVKTLNPKSQVPNPNQIQNPNAQNLTPQDLPRIEKRMREILKRNIKFKKKIISKQEAKELFKDQPYKLELIEELPNFCSSLSPP
jgi:threonyl-tRNA synthetase